MNLLSNKKYFLYFLMMCFIFISTTALSISKNAIKAYKTEVPFVQISKNFPLNPVLSAEAGFPVISAQGVMVVDLDSGTPLYEKNPEEKLLPASTTKIVTALVALDTFRLDQVLTVPKEAMVDGQKMGLYPGEQITVENLLYGLLVYSANDAAMTLAGNYPVSTESGIGNYNAFVAAMNEKAKELSMTSSYFENPVGLDGILQTTTAKDLVRASEVAMRNPVFAKMVGTRSIKVTDATGKVAYNLENINELLGNVPGVLGVKTGWTENARENLVTYIERDNKRILIAVLGSQDRFGETKELVNWIFENYEWQEVRVITLPDNSQQ